MRKIRVMCEGIQFTLFYNSKTTTQIQAVTSLHRFFPYLDDQTEFLNWNGTHLTVNSIGDKFKFLSGYSAN